MMRKTGVILAAAFLVACEGGDPIPEEETAPAPAPSRAPRSRGAEAPPLDIDTAYVGDIINVTRSSGPSGIMRLRRTGVYELIARGEVTFHYRVGRNERGPFRRFSHILRVIDTLARDTIVVPPPPDTQPHPPPLLCPDGTQPPCPLPPPPPPPPIRCPDGTLRQPPCPIPPPPPPVRCPDGSLPPCIVVPPPPPAIKGKVAPNLPAGFSFLTSRDFSTVATSVTPAVGPNGWANNEARYTSTLSLLSDPAAPGTPPSILRYRFPTGLQSGTGPASTRYYVTNPNARSLYVSTWVRFSLGWFGNTKIFYVWWTGGSYTIRADSRLGTTGPLQPYLGMNNGNFLPGFRNNIHTGITLQRGQWHLIEFVVDLSSTPNAPDGAVRVWVDGVLAASRSSWSIAGSPPFTEVRFSTIYDAAGSVPVPADQWMDFDHVVVAGR